MKRSESFETKIDSLHPSGYGTAVHNSRPVAVWNSLPGETVIAKQTGKKKKQMIAVAEKILYPSPDRIAPMEDHFLSCSPWSIMTWEAENLHKNTNATDNRQKGRPLIGSTRRI